MKGLLCFVCLAATGTLSAKVGLKERSPKILNGQDAHILDYPYMLFFYHISNYNDVTFCGATIIGEQWALTSAHCVAGIPNHQLYIHSNLTDFIFESVQILAVEIVVHPLSKITGISADYDIALVKVYPQFRFGPGVQPMGLPEQDQETSPGENGIITGWGQSQNVGYVSASEILQVGAVRIVRQARCKALYANAPSSLRAHVNKRMICAKGVSADCKGDSGGPLVVNNRLVGIVSWGSARCHDYPTVYTRVAYFRDWIRNRSGL